MAKKSFKGSVTDKKIRQIVLDVYMNDSLYPIYYKAINDFFDPMNGFDRDSYNKIREVEYDENGGISGVKGPMDNFPALFMSTITYTKEEGDIFGKLIFRPVKSIDLEKKYNISNVTLKTRLKDYLGATRIQEGKRGYLGFRLDYDTMLGVVLYNYFESKEGKKQSDIIKTFALLQGNK